MQECAIAPCFNGPDYYQINTRLKHILGRWHPQHRKHEFLERSTNPALLPLGVGPDGLIRVRDESLLPKYVEMDEHFRYNFYACYYRLTDEYTQ